MAVGGSGAAFVTGITAPSGPFPVSPGAQQSSCSSGACGFVSQLNPAIPGKGALISSTFVGGESQAFPCGIGLDSNDDVYIAGTLQTYNISQFPTTLGAFQTTPHGGATTGFIMKLSSNAERLIYATFLGGGYNQGVYALTVDPSGVRLKE